MKGIIVQYKKKLMVHLTIADEEGRFFLYANKGIVSVEFFGRFLNLGFLKKWNSSVD